jgi:hypothetical protein
MTEPLPEAERRERAEVPWGEPTPEQAAAYARYEQAASDRYYNVPARTPELREEYDLQEEAERQDRAGEERFIHFNGTHVADPAVPHGNCVDFCPYDTPEQAAERAAARDWVERQEELYAAEMEAEQREATALGRIAAAREQDRALDAGRDDDLDRPF